LVSVRAPRRAAEGNVIGLLFVPMVDFEKLNKPNIIDDF